MMRPLLLCVALLPWLSACNTDSETETPTDAPVDTSVPLAASDAWIREAPPGATATAGYVQLRNNTATPIQCDGASGADFGAIELHRSVIEDGASRMLRNQVLEVPAQGSAELAPGGYHLMLFRPQRPLAAGDHSTLTLHCGDQRPEIDFTLRPAS